MQAPDLVVVERARRPLGVDAGLEERLVDVHVPEPRDERLVEQHRLDRARAARRAGSRAPGRVNRGDSGSMPDPAGPVALAVGEGRGHDPGPAEAARVAEGHGAAVVEVEPRAQEALLVAVGGRAGAPVQAAGHAQVHRERVARVELHEQVLAAPADRLDAPPLDPRRERVRVLGADEQGVVRPSRARSPGPACAPRAGGGSSRPQGAPAPPLPSARIERRRRDRIGRDPQAAGHHLARLLGRPLVAGVDHGERLALGDLGADLGEDLDTGHGVDRLVRVKAPGAQPARRLADAACVERLHPAGAGREDVLAHGRHRQRPGIGPHVGIAVLGLDPPLRRGEGRAGPQGLERRARPPRRRRRRRTPRRARPRRAPRGRAGRAGLRRAAPRRPRAPPGRCPRSARAAGPWRSPSSARGGPTARRARP